MTITVPGPPAVAPDPAADDDMTRLILGWLIAQQSRHTRRAYAKDVDPGVIPLLARIEAQQAGRESPEPRTTLSPRIPKVPPWRTWCRMARVDLVAGVTRDHVNLYARAMEAAGLSAPTRARKLAAISSWYIWLCEGDLIAENPATHVKRPKVDRDASVTPGLTKDQALALMKAADEARGKQRLRTSALVSVMLFSGARAAELVTADVEDLGMDRGHRVLWVTRKGEKRQALALPPPAAERLDAYLASRDDMENLPAVPGPPGTPRPHRPLFAAEKKKESGGRVWAEDIWYLIRRLGKAAGLPADLVSHLGAHSVRHSYATLYLDAGGSLRDLQDAMGHADPRTTRRYDRARYSLDRSPGYLLASYLAAPEGES